MITILLYMVWLHDYFKPDSAGKPVYKLFGKAGPGTHEFPAPGDTTLLNPLGYYMLEGGYAVLPADLDVFVTFIKQYFLAN